jgi:hypothetical protein
MLNPLVLPRLPSGEKRARIMAIRLFIGAKSDLKPGVKRFA